MAPKPLDEEGYLVDAASLKRLGDGRIDEGRARLRLLLADERPRTPIKGPTERPPNVRLATQRDEPALLDLLLADLAENAEIIAAPSISQIMRQIEPGTRNQGSFVPVVDGPSGWPVALAILCPLKWWWSDQLYLSETVMYVAPEARGSNAAQDILDYEKWLSDAMTEQTGDTVFLMAGVTATRRRSAKQRFYARRMNPIGTFHIYPAIGDLEL